MPTLRSSVDSRLKKIRKPIRIESALFDELIFPSACLAPDMRREPVDSSCSVRCIRSIEFRVPLGNGDASARIEQWRIFMRHVQTLAAAVFALASLPLIAQQTDSAGQQQAAPPQAPAAQAQPQATQPTQAAAAPSAMAAVELSPVNGELVDKLDTKTAKTGDSVVIKTQSNVRTADGTEIPKGSKLMGKVVQVKPSGDANENSQVALQFDRAELKGGQSVAIHSEIQSLSPSGSDAPSSTPDTMAATPGGSSGPAAAAPGGSTNGAGSATTTSPAQQPQMGSSSSAAGQPAPGTIVARTGNIAIRTTSFPGVLLANNEPGQQDPRMAQSSGILLGAKRDVQLDGGTKVVMGVAASGTNPGGN
jgi:hypothetical protein